MAHASILKELDRFIRSLPVTYMGYTFTRMIGSGGFSAIFQVTSPRYDHDFVCKVMPKRKLNDGKSDYDFLLQLCHSAIVSIYEKFEDKNYVYLIMEYCTNGNLETQVSNNHMFNNNPDLLLTYMKLLIAGLDYCHSHGVAHRDIKPSNIVLNNYMKPKYIDFGISRKVQYGEMITELSGSGPFLAPELILNGKSDPFKADIWSLGVTFYYCALGTLPWAAKSGKLMEKCIEQGLYTIPKTVDIRIAKILFLMMNVDPNKRPSCRDLLQLDIFNNHIHFETLPSIYTNHTEKRNQIPLSFSSYKIGNRSKLKVIQLSKSSFAMKTLLGNYVPEIKPNSKFSD